MFLFKKIGGFLEDKLKLNGVVDLMMSGWSKSLPASISEWANIGPICFVYRGYPRICKVTLITARCMVKYQADIKQIYIYR